MQPGTNWGGAYSRWTFDELKQYMLVAKEMLVPGTQQGVPLLDAELNENAEILLTLIRRLIHRGFGNGTEGVNFQILQSATNPDNNLTIKGGEGTAAGAAYIFVEGWMLLLASDLEYTTQPGVSALTTPVGNRVDAVYLDLYLDEVAPADDPDLIDPGIGFETSRRVKLNWSVRVAEGAGAPTAYSDASNRFHWTYRIATLNRLAGDPKITSAMVVDQRNTAKAVKAREAVHRQTTGTSVWTINHNLGVSFVDVTVYDDDMVQIEPGEIKIMSSNQVRLDFSGVNVTGTAIVNGLTAF